MIKLYLDWNVMAQIKDGIHAELESIVFNDKKLLIPYSTSHISDILSSFKEDDKQLKLIDKDLVFISRLTNNACLFNNGKDIVLDFASPQEYYQQRLDEKDLLEDLSIDKLFNQYENVELIGGLVKPYLNLLKQFPLDSIFKESFENPEASQQMETLFPGLKDNLTMDGFFKAFGKMYKNLNEDDKYKDLRKLVQSGLGINRDQIFDSKRPYDILQEKYKQIGQFESQNSPNEKHAPKWFNEIANEYIRLDMHGYQEDKVNVGKGRKETFKNTTEDAFHAAFASTCNFYVINDKKSYKKTKQVFEKLQINTLVLKPEEFVHYYKDYLGFEDPSLNINIPFALLQKGEYTEQQLEGAILRTYYFPFFLFGFFTKLMLLLPGNEEMPILLLSRTKPTNGTTYIMEITRLAKEISSLFGEDIQKLGEVKEEEFAEVNWIGRSWKFDNLSFRLASPNGHFQLYIHKEESQQAT